MNVSLTSTSAGATAGDPLLIGRFVFSRREADELHWVQRWVEVHETFITTHTKQGEAPVRVYRIVDVEVVDEGDRHFSIVLSLSQPESPDKSQRCRSSLDGGGPYRLPPEHDADEVSSILFRTANDCVDEANEEAFSSLGDSHGSSDSAMHERRGTIDVGPAGRKLSNSSESDDNAETIRFRCCDRIECLEMLQAIEHALWLARCKHATTQTVALSEFGRMEVAVDAWKDLQSQLLDAQQTVVNLRSELEQMRERALEAEARWGRERTALEAQFQSALCEAKRRLDAATRRLHQERELAVSATSAKHQEQLDALQMQLLAMQQTSEAAQRAMQLEKDGLRRQLADLAAARQSKRQADAASSTVEGLQTFLQMRRDHTSWLRHHLCTEQIARFSLSLKRASQILSRVPGSAQFAKEFAHDWPIAARLIELPVMVLEEDRMLVKIIEAAANRKQLLSAAGAGLCGGAGTHVASPTTFKRSLPPPCASPACGGSPTVVHECSAFAITSESHLSAPPDGAGDTMLGELLRARSQHASAEAFVEALGRAPPKQSRRHCERSCCGAASSVPAILQVSLKHHCTSSMQSTLPGHLSEG